MKRFALIGALALIGARVFAMDFQISRIIVVGASRAPESYIRGLLPFREGSTFPSLEAIERVLETTRLRLIGTMNCLEVDMTVNETSPGSVEVDIGVIEGVTNGFRSDQVFSAFDNFPFKGISAGFSIDGWRQSLLLCPAGSYPLRLLFVASNNLLGDSQLGLSTTVEPQLIPIPEVQVRAPIRYLHAFGTAEGAKTEDTTVGIAIRIDCEYLKNIIGFGFSEEARAEYGFWQYEYWRIGNSLEMTVKPFRYFELLGRADIFDSFGNFPSWKSPDLSREGGIRGPLDPDLVPESGSLAAGVEVRLTDLIRLDLGFTKMWLVPFAFAEAGRYFDPSSLDLASGFVTVFGGGVGIVLPPPFALRISPGVGYNPSIDQLGFIISIETG